MDNNTLKQIFKNLHAKITRDVNPDSIIDVLYSKNIISDDDNYTLCHVPDSRTKCRKLMSLLHLLSHPQVFIELRAALLDNYSWIVGEIDEQLASHTGELQQFHLGQSKDGKSVSSYSLHW